MSGKSSGSAPQYAAPPADNSEMMAAYMLKMQEVMQGMTRGISQAQNNYTPEPPPPTETVEAIDWDAKKADLAAAISGEQEEAARRARGTAYTMQSSPLLDAEEPEVLRI